MASLTEEEIRDGAEHGPAPRRGGSGLRGFASRLPADLSRLLANFRGFLARGRFSSLISCAAA